MIAVPGLAFGQTAAERLNDFPTAARADYVFACMSTNGTTREMLQKCSCSVDEVAQINKLAKECDVNVSRRGRPPPRAAAAHAPPPRRCT